MANIERLTALRDDKNLSIKLSGPITGRYR